MANYIQDGKSIDYTPGSAVAAGDVVVQGDLVGVAVADIAANALGALQIEGVFSFAKNTNSTDIYTVGQKLYWNASSEVVSTSSSGNKYLGKVVKAAAAADTTVNVKLEQ